MCLITEKKSKVLIAEEDLIVYKHVLKCDDEKCKSSMRGFVYELGKLYETEIREEKDPDELSFADEDDAGYSYKNFGTKFAHNLCAKGKHIGYGQGFHSFTKPKESMKSWDACIVQCTIPKGSKYIKGFVGYLISNQIIINKYL